MLRSSALCELREAPGPCGGWRGLRSLALTLAAEGDTAEEPPQVSPPLSRVRLSRVHHSSKESNEQKHTTKRAGGQERCSLALAAHCALNITREACRDLAFRALAFALLVLHE